MKQQTRPGDLNALSLSIAGIPISVSCDNPDFIHESLERFSNFIDASVKTSPEIDIDVFVSESPVGLTGDELYPDTEPPGAGHGWTFSWHGCRGDFDWATRKGTLVTSPNPLGLNSFLRFIYSILLPDDGGLLLHASSLVRNGRAYVFPGKSGAGKTTITRLSPGAVLLSDEISLIRPAKEGTLAWGTPFWGMLAIGGENVSSLVKGFYFPVQDKSNYLQALNPARVLAKLLPTAVCFSRDEKAAKRLFDICAGLATRVPGYDLHFLPEQGFWRCIDDEPVRQQE